MKRELAQRIVKFLDTILVTAVMFLTISQYYINAISNVNPFGTILVMSIMFWIIYVYCTRLYSGFLIMISRISDLIYSQMLSIIIADLLIFFLLLLVAGRMLPLFPMFNAVCYQFVIVFFWSVISHKWYFTHYSALRTLFIYGDYNYYASFMNEYGFKKKFNIIKAIPLKEYQAENMDDYLEGIQTILVSDIPMELREALIQKCYDLDIGIYFLPGIGDVLMSNAKAIDVCHHPILRIFHYKTLEYRFIKRIADIIISAIALIILSPVMIFTAIAIKLQDGGPVFYRQKRLTENGRIFEILKFRSMRVDAEKNGVARLSSGANDDRITPIGRFIRMVRIDELPQLINIINGDMSIVGPRPERPEIAEQYLKELPEFNLRLRVKAGLTGYAQVYGQYNTTPKEKLLMDLLYIANPSVQFDFQLMLATVKILFLPESTEGVAQGQNNALRREQ